MVKMNDKNEYEEFNKEVKEQMEDLSRRSDKLQRIVGRRRKDVLTPKHPYTTFIDEHPNLNIEDFKSSINEKMTYRELKKEIDKGGEKFILQSLEIENFKSIKKSKINLGTSSFISGYNSSGKSTHTQLILLLIQWLSGESVSQKGSVPLNGPFITLGDNARDLINRSIQQEFEKSQKDAFEM